MAQQDTHPNYDTIRGLREVADWLEQHPELPKAWYGALRWDFRLDDVRERLTELAAAFGDRSIEVPGASEVEIRGEFPGRINVAGTAPMHLLAHEPIVPKYEPILPVASAQVAS